MLSISVPIAMLVTRSRMNSTTTGTRCFVISSRAVAKRRGQRPSERPRLPRIDPVARLVDAEELRAGDLRQADHGDISGVAAKRLVHLLVDALRLDRNVVEMALAQH